MGFECKHNVNIRNVKPLIERFRKIKFNRLIGKIIRVHQKFRSLLR